MAMLICPRCIGGRVMYSYGLFCLNCGWTPERHFSQAEARDMLAQEIRYSYEMNLPDCLFNKANNYKRTVKV